MTENESGFKRSYYADVPVTVEDERRREAKAEKERAESERIEKAKSAEKAAEAMRAKRAAAVAWVSGNEISMMTSGAEDAEGDAGEDEDTPEAGETFGAEEAPEAGEALGAGEDSEQGLSDADVTSVTTPVSESMEDSRMAQIPKIVETPDGFPSDGSDMEKRRLRAVVIGGGTGAPVSIRTLLDMGFDVSAVVAMTDDGGSTGILRERAGAIPPGDIRKCLVAMAQDDDDPFVKAFKYRFDYANNHALGNLIITALADTGSTFPEAISICGKLLHCRGHVYPSTLDQVTLCGRTRDGRTIAGQSAISHSDCALERVYLDPEDPHPYMQALAAISHADLIVLGPGSLFTSIIPNILVPGVVDAIRESAAPTVFVCSTADVQGETWGLSSAEHVEALLDHGLKGMLDFVLLQDSRPLQAKPSSATTIFARISGGGPAKRPAVPVVEDRSASPQATRPVRHIAVNDELIDRIRDDGPQVILRDFVNQQLPNRHDPARLADAFREVCDRCHLQPR